MGKRMTKHLAGLSLLVLLAGLCVPALAGNTLMNFYIEKETLNEEEAARKAICSKNGELRVTRQSVYPWDEEGSHWSVFVELENTSDAPIVMDETWLYTCKADKETTATWHFPLIDGAFYRTASRFYPGERVILYAGSEPVYALQYDAQGQYTGKEDVPGNFVDRKGNVLGRHRGITHYTIGQRKGLGLSMGHPVFVVEIRPETNEVVIGENEDVFTNILHCSKLNWMAVEGLDDGQLRLTAKIRYSHKDEPCVIRRIGEDLVECVFDRPVRAATPGQAVVFYQGDYVAGGGTIR